MTAVSRPINGQSLNNQERIERNYDAWEYISPKGQERAKPSFSKPFSANNQPFIDRNFDYSLQSTPLAHAGGTPEYSGLLQSSLIEHTFTTGQQTNPRANSKPNPTYLSPHNIGGPRPALSDVSRSGSEPDSLLDLYGRPRSQIDSGDLMDRAAGTVATFGDDEDPEHSRWIHRDKLALIESHEMQEAGIRLSRLETANSKSNGLAERIDHNGAPDDDQDLCNEEQGDQAMSSSLSPQQEQEEAQNKALPFDLRTPEEIAAGPHIANTSPSVHRSQGLRSSSSRIPLPKSSPVPIPHEHIVRNTPLARNRGGSGNWNRGDEDSISYSKTRSRGPSVGSQVLLDDGEPLDGTPKHAILTNNQESPSTSPSKHAGNKTTQNSSSGPRKAATSALRNASESQKPRTPSSTNRSSPGQHPKSRSGLEARPATAINRPEGDPPWLATMFKPDPMLPPDQQLLPTHAKRLQQEKDGIPVPKPDDDINKADMDTAEAPQPSDPGNDLQKQENLEDEAAWPLRASPLKENGSSGQGGPEHGGYSTIPKVQITPPMGTIASPKAIRPPNQENEMPQQGGCGCCAIM